MGDDRPTDAELNRLQWTPVLYYLHETNHDNGSVRDKADPACLGRVAIYMDMDRICCFSLGEQVTEPPPRPTASAFGRAWRRLP
jgi:hypothetical protein